MSTNDSIGDRKRKVVFLAEGYGPYRVPFWNELGRHVDLAVLLFGKVEKGRDWNVNLEEVTVDLVTLDAPQLHIGHIDWAAYLVYGKVLKALDRLSPDVLVVGGWASPGYWAARSWGLTRSIPLVFWSESHSLSTRTRGVWPFDAIKRRFLKAFDAYYAFSPLSADYLLGFGVDKSKVFLSYNLPDISAFPRHDREGGQGISTFVYVGRLNVRKGLLQMFQALAQLTHRPWKLLIAGTGPLEPELRRLAARDGFLDRIEFLGYVQQKDLSAVYRRADVFLFLSLNEVWGLVLHEALLSGTYSIASDRAAATHALLKPNENGVMVSPYDIDRLTRTIDDVLDRIPFDRKAIRQTVSHITLEGEVAKLVAAIHLASTGGTPA